MAGTLLRSCREDGRGNLRNRFYSGSTYGQKSFLAFNAQPFFAKPYLYGSLRLAWVSPTGNWSRIRLVRSSFGFPVQEDDGAVLFDLNSGPSATGTIDAGRVTYDDSLLTQGRFYYYTLFVLATDIDGLGTSEWRRAGNAIGLAPKDFRYTERMLDRLPSVYTTAVQEVGGHADPNTTLSRFLSIFGFELDYIRTQYENLRNLYDPSLVAGTLLPTLAEQLGIVYEPEIGVRQTRILIRNLMTIRKRKGTLLAAEALASSFTGWGAKATVGYNLLLDYDDSTFEDGLGRWAAECACTIARRLGDNAIASYLAPDFVNLQSAMLAVTSLGPLATPVNGAFTNATTGGTLAPGTYSYRVSATNYSGETLASTQTTIAVPAGASTNAVTVTWAAVPNASGYRVYGRTAGNTLLIASVGAVTSYVDTGAVTPAGAVAASNTSGDAVVRQLQGGRSAVGFGIPVQGGSAYAASVYARAGQAQTRASSIGVEWYDQRGLLISTSESTGTVTSSTAWTARPTTVAFAPASVVAPINETATYPATGTLLANYPYSYRVSSLNSGLETTASTPFTAIIPTGNAMTANNSSFETDVSGYLSASAIARNTSVFYSGTASLQITAGGTAGFDVFVLRNAANASAVIPGQVYTASAQVRAATSGRSFSVFTTWLDSNYAVISEPQGATFADNTGGWTQGYTTTQAPANAAYASVHIAWGTGGAGEVHYVDAVGLFPDPTGNLVTNPDFENGTAGWIATSSTITASAVQSYTGRQSLAVAPGGAGSGTLTDFRTYSDYVKAPVGTVTTTSCYVWTATATTGRMSVQHDNAGGTAVLSYEFGPTVTIPAATWTRLVCTSTVPAGGGNARVEPIVLSGTAVFYVDAVQVVVGTVAQPYVPPTTSNLALNPGPVGTSNGAVIGAFSNSTSTGSDPTVPSGVYTRFTGYSGFGYIAFSLPAGIYTISEWWRSADNRNVSMYYEGSASAGLVNVGGNPGVVLAAGVWQKVVRTVQITTPGDLKAGFLGGAAGFDFDISSVQIELGSTANDYISGVQGSAYSWDSSNNATTNPAFTADVSNWSSNNSTTPYTLTRVTGVSPGAAGVTTAMDVSIPANSNIYQLILGRLNSNFTYFVVGQTYTASFYARSISGATGLTLIFANGAGVNSAGPSTNFTMTTAWQRFTYTFTATGGAADTQWYIAQPIGASDYQITALQVEQRNYATPYGSTGTPNSSTSTRQQPWSLPNGAVALKWDAVPSATSYRVYGRVNGAEGLLSTVTATAYTDTGAAAIGALPPTTNATRQAAYAGLLLRVKTPAAGELHVFDAVQFEQNGAARAFQEARDIRIALQADRINEVPNPSAELDTRGWVAGGNTTLARSTLYAYSGDELSLTPANFQVASFRMTAQAAGNVTMLSDILAVTANTPYTLTAYATSTASRVSRVDILYYDTSGTLLGTSFGPQTGTTATRWFRSGVTSISPAGTTDVRVRLVGLNCVAGDIINFDAVLLERDIRQRPYFDASFNRQRLSDYLWEGGDAGQHFSRSHYYFNRRNKNFRLVQLEREYTALGSTFSLLYAQGPSAFVTQHLTPTFTTI